MGRVAEGWKLRPHGRIWYVRFRWRGKRYEITTGEREIGAARARAPEIYASIVSGRVEQRSAKQSTLTVALNEWLEGYEAEHAAGTTKTMEMYAEAHWVPFFDSAERFTTAGIEDYRRVRLRVVTRTTIRKELSGLRLFAEWWRARGGPLVDVPHLPKKGFPGTRHARARKEQATIVTPARVEKILAAMPEKNQNGAWVRPLFRVLWETALRPRTVFALTAPKHFRKGARELLITRDIDKAQAERKMSLTGAARAALELVVNAVDVGTLFPSVQLRDALERACSKAKVPRCSVYDLRHSRLTLWANAGAPLAGVAYLAGHTRLSTTAIYVRSQRKAADQVIRLTSRLQKGNR